MLYSRFLKFIDSIQTGNKITAKVLLEMIRNDTETITGGNITKILIETEQSGIQNVDSNKIKNLKFCEMSKNEEWRIYAIRELTDIQQGKMSLIFDNDEQMEKDEFENLITFIAST